VASEAVYLPHGTQSLRRLLPACPQYPSNTPYAHWTRTFANNSLADNASCAVALFAERYDYFLGDDGNNVTQVNSASLYSAAGFDAKYG
jgi:hypothetical protein